MSNRFTRLLRLSLVATIIAAGAAAFSMREAPPASAQSQAATVAVSCPASAVSGENFTCDITVTNTSEVFGAPAALAGPLVLEYGLYEADYAVFAAGPSGPFVEDGHLPGRFVAVDGMAAGQSVDLDVTFTLMPDAHYTTNSTGDDFSFEASLYQSDRQLLAPIALAEGETDIEYDAEADLSIDLDNLTNEFGAAPGGLVLFTASVCNAGPSDVRGIGLNDTASTNLLNIDVSMMFSNSDMYIRAGGCVESNITAQVDPAAAVGDPVSLTVSTIVGTVDWGAAPSGTVNDPSDTSTQDPYVIDALPDADLEVVSITPSTTAIVPGGGPINFQIEVANNGPAPAYGAVLVNNLLDVQWTIDSAGVPPGWERVSNGGTWIATEPLPAGYNETFGFQIYFDSDAHYVAPPGGLFDFGAFIGSASPDPAIGNNGLFERLDMEPSASLSIDKTLLNDSPTGVSSGGTAFYDIEVCNAGPSDVKGIGVLDTPGTGLNAASLVISPQALSGMYVAAGDCGNVIATVDLLDTQQVGDAFSNMAALDATNVDDGASTNPFNPTLGPPSVAAGTTGEYLPDADMDATATITPLTIPPVAGQQYSFQVSVANLGPAPAEGATAHVNLGWVPGSWQVTLQPGSPLWKCDGNGMTCSRTGSMPATDPQAPVAETVATFTILLPENLMVDGFANGDFVIDLSVTASNPDPNLLNNQTFIIEEAVGIATLDVEKSDLTDPVGQGQYFSYELVVQNNGPTTLPENEVLLVDTLPAEVSFVGGSPNCVHNGAPQGGVVTCTVPDELAPQDSYDFLINVLVDDGVLPGTILMNTVETQTPNLLPPTWTITQDQDQEDTEVVAGPEADLKITKLVKPDDTVYAGDVFTYSIYVDNLGPFAAPNVWMTDTIIADGPFEVLSITEDRGGVCMAVPPYQNPVAPSIDNRYIFDCNLPVLVRGDRWTIIVEAVAQQDIDVNNDARVIIGAQPPGVPPVVDPDLSNNMSMQSIDVIDNADLEILKVANNLPWTLGGPAQWEIAVANLGPSVADNVRVFDLLPEAVDPETVTYVITDGAGNPAPGSCTIGTPGDPADPMRCDLGEIGSPVPAAGPQSRSIVIDAILDPSYSENVPSANDILVNNDVWVTADTYDLNNSNNRDNVTVNVAMTADLAIRKDALGPFPWIAGESRTYQIFVTNQGPADATQVALFDQLPVDAQGRPLVTFQRAWVAKSGDEGGGLPLPCKVSSDNGVDCFLGRVEGGGVAIAAGEEVLISIDVLLHADLPDNTNLTNIARVFSLNNVWDDPNLANNDTGPVDQIVRREADMAVFKRSLPEIVYAGEQKVYEIEVVNQGPSNASLVQVQDFLPPWMTYEVDTNEFCNEAGGTVTCQYTKGAIPAELAPGETWAFEIWTLVDEDAPPGVQALNTAQVTALEAEPGVLRPPFDDGDNFAFSRNLIKEKADLRIQKFGKRDGQVRAGDILTYTVIVDNYGPSWATGTAIKDILQSSFRFDLIDITSDRDAFCVGIPGPGGQVIPGTAWPPTVAPPPFGVLPPTGVADIQERLEVDCTLWDDPNTAVDESRLEVLEADGPPNSGRWILTMRVRAMEDQDINNRAEVTTEAFDPNVDNNSAAVEHEITAVSDIQVTKVAVGEVQVNGQPGLIFDPATPGQAFPSAPNYQASATEVTAGRRIQYTLEVTNFGPTKAENVILTDRLPAGVQIYPGSLTTTQGSCETGTPGEPLDRLVCGLGDLVKTPGQNTATITFEVITDPALAPGLVLENDAYAISDNFDPTNANNHVNTQTVVNTWADMALFKGAVGHNKIYNADLRRFEQLHLIDQVTAGNVLRYELVVQNKGASVARNVQVMEILPQFVAGSDEAVEFLRADGADCRPEDQEVHLGGQFFYCTLGDMAPGERRTFDIYVLVDEAVEDGEILFNQALVLFGPSSPPAQVPPAFPPLVFDLPVLPTTNDPFPGDNFADNQTRVNAVADLFIEKVDVPAAPDLDRPFEPDLAVAGEEHRYKITFGNNGWSVSRDFTVTDFLDPGEEFLRCEPFDLDDEVICSLLGADTVGVESMFVRNEQIIGQTNPFVGDVLRTGEEYTFYLVTQVDSGFVLDEPDFIATNDSEILSGTPDPRFLAGNAEKLDDAEIQQFGGANNLDAHDTEIIARADLEIEKTDIFGNFLECDPVQPGGMLTYNLTITNHGPSDAAQVYVTDWLPALGLALDPAQVMVEVTNGQVVEVRDDGRIVVIVGNDEGQVGRMNVGTVETITISVMVTNDAVCGALLVNTAVVETRRNDVIWPPAPDLLPGVGGGPRTPTMDPDLTNNRVTETTKVECPAIKVVKTVSYDGTCPGQDLPIVWNQTAQPVTFCFEITNTGTTYLDTIRITDTLTTRTQGMPMVIFTDTITSGIDPKIPVAPGEVVTRSVTIPHLTKDCGLAYDRIDVTANPVNSGRTDLTCLNDVTHFDTATIEIPCAGVDRRLALPILNDDNGDCEAWIQVQNVGDKDAKAMLVVWGDPGFCPPQAAGPLKTECSGLLAPGSAWSFAEAQVPPGSRSAVVYSLSNERVEVEPGTRIPFADAVCEAVFFGVVGDYFDWLVFDTAYRTGGTYDGLDFSKYTNEPLAVSVNRSCPDMVDPAITNHAAYTGISSDMFGARDPRGNAYTYYAPLVFNEKRGLTTWIYAQNTGEECTSLEIWFKAQDNCLRATIADVLALAPGESVHLDASTMGPDWLGSAWIRSTQPMALVVDTMGTNHFTSYTGLPADSYELDFTYGNQVNFAPLIYSEYQGWDTAIQVQNLSATHAAKAKVYFLDRSGDIITTLVDWICPRGSQTFFLPVIESIPGNWVGSARVESQEWWSPGSPLVDPPKISSVVLLEKWSDPARTGLREAVAYNAQTECLLFDWQIAPGTKGGTSSGSAVFAIPLVAKGNRGITSEIGITNLVPKPGFTDFAIFLYDQNGLIDWYCQKLNEKQVEYIDLSTWGIINQGFLGSAVVSAVFWEHDVFDGSGNFERNLVGLGGVAVERIGGTQGGPDVPGDESKAFEALPIFDHFDSGEAPNCPGVGTP